MYRDGDKHGEIGMRMWMWMFVCMYVCMYVCTYCMLGWAGGVECCDVISWKERKDRMKDGRKDRKKKAP